MKRHFKISKSKVVILLLLILLITSNYQRLLSILLPNVLLNLNADTAEAYFGSNYYDFSDAIRHNLSKFDLYEDDHCFFDSNNNCEYIFKGITNSKWKMVGFVTYNPNHNIFGVRVGGSYEKAINTLKKQGFWYSEEDNLFSMIRIYIELEREDNSDTITSITIIR